MCLEASWILVNIFQVLDNAVLVYFKHSSTVLETIVPEHFVFLQNRKQHWLYNGTGHYPVLFLAFRCIASRPCLGAVYTFGLKTILSFSHSQM